MSAARAVFIPSNPRQLIAARVAAHALKRNAAHPERFAVRILLTSEFPVLAAHEGLPMLRGGVREIWRNDDLQSFTPLRFAVPAVMGYTGRALVIDPDVFALRDVNHLLDRDLRDAAIVARPIESRSGARAGFASSVMLLDCARLRHWDFERDFRQLFTGERDYTPWMQLRMEPADRIAPLESVWNDFDQLTPRSAMLHNTRRVTQPWKTGLPVDFVVHAKPSTRSPMRSFLRRLRGKTPVSQPTVYRPHPDPAQERLFFSLMAECLEQGSLTRAMVEAAIARQELRHDALHLLGKAGLASAHSTPRTQPA